MNNNFYYITMFYICDKVVHTEINKHRVIYATPRGNIIHCTEVSEGGSKTLLTGTLQQGTKNLWLAVASHTTTSTWHLQQSHTHTSSNHQPHHSQATDGLPWIVRRAQGINWTIIFAYTTTLFFHPNTQVPSLEPNKNYGTKNFQWFYCAVPACYYWHGQAQHTV